MWILNMKNEWVCEWLQNKWLKVGFDQPKNSKGNEFIYLAFIYNIWIIFNWAEAT